MKEVAERCGSYLCVIVSPHRLAYGPQMVRNKVILYCLPSPRGAFVTSFPLLKIGRAFGIKCHSTAIPSLFLLLA